MICSNFKDFTISVLAKESACFSSTEYSMGYQFNAPLSGELEAVELYHRSGSVTSSLSNGYNNWGGFYDNGDPMFLTLLLRENNNGSKETLFPDANTDGITTLSADYCATCPVWLYEMEDYDATLEVLRWTVTGSTIHVSTADVFSLQYSEGCCGLSTSDNNGTSCADVYFEYASVTTGLLHFIGNVIGLSSILRMTNDSLFIDLFSTCQHRRRLLRGERSDGMEGWK